MSEMQEQARVLRLRGLSITAISQQLGMPRSSTFAAVRDIQLTCEQKYKIVLTTGNRKRNEIKTCPKCGTSDLERFGPNKSRWDGLQVVCRLCLTAQYHENKPCWRGYALKKYGLNNETYAVLLLKQGGVCALCGKPPLGNERLVVDHDHTTGVVRGLIHGVCNTVIGYAKDDVDLLRKAIIYLENHLSNT